MFEVVTPQNTAKITLTNKLTGHSETWLIGTSPASSALAVLSFAKVQNVNPKNVSYSTVYPEETVNAKG